MGNGSSQVNSFNKHVFEVQYKHMNKGLIFSLIGVIALMFIDYFYYDVIEVVRMARMAVLSTIFMSFLLCRIFGHHQRAVRTIYLSSLILSTCIEAIMVSYAYSIDQVSYGFESQVFLLFLIGLMMFATVIRDLLLSVYGIGLVAYFYGMYTFGDAGMLFSFQTSNIVLLTVGVIIFNHLYLHSRIDEFLAEQRNIKQIKELNEEIEKRQRLQYKLREMATYDGLTTSYTRGTGLDILEKGMRKSDRDYKSLTICYIDINNLKEINDLFGHNIGDVYIIGLVDILNDYSRSQDYVIRLGGDEFLMVMPDATYFEAERLWRDVRIELEKFSHEGTSVDFPLEVSHGIVEYVDGNYKTTDALLEVADKLMYKEKKASKRKVMYK